MQINLTKAHIKFLANLFTNLTAGWIGLIILTPELTGLRTGEVVYDLIFNVYLAIMYSVISIKLEEILEQYE